MTGKELPDDTVPLATHPLAPGHMPLCDPEPYPVGDATGTSSGSMSITVGDSCLSCWGSAETLGDGPAATVQLQLAPDRPVVIGRQEGGAPPYLDPAFSSTTLVPGTSQTVVQSGGGPKDTFVSRAHFMLRGHAGGIMLTNGVPRVGGGIRPPVNRTWLHAGNWRAMDPGEDYLIEHGAMAVLSLPNGTVVKICAE